jgi:hypothetical protein
VRIRAVSWFSRILALVLLALWVPATSHCAVETVLGIVNEHCEAVCAHDDSATDAHPAADACEMLERGEFKPAVAELAAPAPALTVLACLSHVHAALLAEARPLAPPAWSGDHPADWVPVRHLASRAVAPARAPNLI